MYQKGAAEQQQVDAEGYFIGGNTVYLPAFMSIESQLPIITNQWNSNHFIANNQHPGRTFHSVMLLKNKQVKDSHLELVLVALQRLHDHAHGLHGALQPAVHAVEAVHAA